MKTKIRTGLLLVMLVAGLILNAQNHALDFDGLDDKIGVLDSPELNPNGMLTLELWMNGQPLLRLSMRAVGYRTYSWT